MPDIVSANVPQFFGNGNPIFRACDEADYLARATARDFWMNEN
jgi:hypothetical protein